MLDGSYTVVCEGSVSANEVLGARVREMRALRGLRQKELAKLVGMSQSHLSELERGGGCSRAMLQRIADALDSSAAYLMGESPFLDESAVDGNEAAAAAVAAAQPPAVYQPRIGDVVTVLEEGRTTVKVVQRVGDALMLKPIADGEGEFLLWPPRSVSIISFTRRLNSENPK